MSFVHVLETFVDGVLTDHGDADREAGCFIPLGKFNFAWR